MTVWNSARNIERVGKDEIRANLCIKSDSPWFSGHFPGNPILPGIAQLGAVFEAINDMMGGNLKISRIRRVRFKQIIRPDDPVHLVLRQNLDDPYSYSFKIMLKDEVACSGSMITGENET